MARSRNIKPGFFENEELAALNPLARLLFAGLWTIADREGRLEDRHKRIKKQLLPYDRCKVDDLLNALQRAGFIVRYQVGARRCISILTFRRHQHPHMKEPPSTLPAPDSDGASHDLQRSGPEFTRTSPADSLVIENLNQKSLNGSLGGGVQFTDIHHATWDDFIADWPNKVSLQQARLRWLELFNETDGPEELLRAILDGKERYKVSAQWARGFIEAPDNWLKKKKWLDSPQPDTHTFASVWDEIERGDPNAG